MQEGLLEEETEEGKSLFLPSSLPPSSHPSLIHTLSKRPTLSLPPSHPPPFPPSRPPSLPRTGSLSLARGGRSKPGGKKRWSGGREG